MAIRTFQKAVVYLKEIQDIGLFGVMTDARLFAMFSGSPLYYIMFPFIAILLTILAAINGYQLATANNKNFDKSFALIVSVVSAICSSVSLYGAVIATAMGVTFAAGSWFFLTGVSLAGLHQIVMLGLNLYRAYESRFDPVQRMHHIQAALSNLFVLGLLTSIVGAIVFVILTPAAPVLGTACAIAAVAFTVAAMIWQLTPYNWKQAIKDFLHLGKPELTEQPVDEHVSELVDGAEVNLSGKPEHYTRLFSHTDYGTQVRRMNPDEGKTYLEQAINNKIIRLNVNKSHLDEKDQQKMDLLTRLLDSLKDKKIISREDLLTQYPLVFQSFWAEKGEVEQLFDAVSLWQDKVSLNHIPVQSNYSQALNP
ncbi:hypothetical protein [Legionella shakespearei]|uniref:Uncharacterized protein n=1 Tax=Legionella shakespearei DSM 23087 TaxID=1122169 RepID=A0A0W0YQ52_9GAMM|nr:hypothetical protein [Legionella shakespearei]KTD59005.1 hypothetical protein Lsha_2037 [Legionella shakespearei DSM 23087]